MFFYQIGELLVELVCLCFYLALYVLSEADAILIAFFESANTAQKMFMTKLDIFAEKIHNGKLHFLSSETVFKETGINHIGTDFTSISMF